jgi:hypothetical protein
LFPLLVVDPPSGEAESIEEGDSMWKTLYLVVMFLGLLRTTPAQTIPKELWGTWVVRREVPTTTISCRGEKEAKKLIGTEVQYSATLFRRNKVVRKIRAHKRQQLRPTSFMTRILAEV